MLEYLEKRNLRFWITTSSMFVVGIGIIDYLTGYELAFSLFYLIPIVLVTWFSGRNAGLLICIFSSMVWFLADDMAGRTYSQPFILYWNAVVRLSFFVLVAILLPALKALRHEQDLARTDYLTGIANRRHFFELAQAELDRADRYKHPITIVYLDLDEFKNVNDHGGHRAGDEVLRAIVDHARSRLRKTDTMARLGGDEFVILLPETGQAEAKVVVAKIQKSLMEKMQQNRWPVTFSIGVLTCLAMQITVDELIKKADNIMYSVKKSGKNAIAYEVYGGLRNESPAS